MQRRQAPGNTVNILGPSLTASLYSFVGYTGNMWRADHVFHLEQRVCGFEWFLCKDIQARGADLAALYCCDQGGLVHQRATGDVDQHGCRLHLLKFPLAYKVAGLCREWRMQGEIVHFA